MINYIKIVLRQSIRQSAITDLAEFTSSELPVNFIFLCWKKESKLNFLKRKWIKNWFCDKNFRFKRSKKHSINHIISD